MARRVVGPGIRFDFGQGYLSDGAAELRSNPASKQAAGHIKYGPGQELID
jgi:hypothetical protein